MLLRIALSFFGTQSNKVLTMQMHEDPLESRAGLPMCIKSVNKNRLTIVIGNEK